MNAKRYSNGAFVAITHHNPTAAMALDYCEVIINAARTVNKGVNKVEENQSWERQKVHAVPLLRYMGKGTEGLQMMQDEIHAENQSVVIPVPVRWLANPHSIREKRLNGEISASSVGFVLEGDMVGWRPVKGGIMLAGGWYQVEPFTNVGPDSRCDHCRGWGHKES